MKYIYLLAMTAVLAACQNFSINNPNPYATYNYDYSSCCYEGNQPRP
jgi:hypothetical protein